MTPERDTDISSFLNAAGWGMATRGKLAGDASNRRYERLTDGPEGTPAVLMDADPAKGEDIRPFIRIAEHLTGLGLSAPTILAQDEAQGFLLLEDLGDALFARLLERDPAREEELYIAATEVLIQLHAAAPPSAPDYGPETMTNVAGIAFSWYGFGATGDKNGAGMAAMQSALAGAFATLQPWSPVLVLRDYHAENLFWLPERSGAARVGLIDFQDAGLGHPAYDLVSLGRDVRRDVRPETYEAMLAHYATATGQDIAAFTAAAATLSAQRNLRILGVFARLSMHFGKPAYVDLIPRTWTTLMADLAHPSLNDLRATVLAGLPVPTPQILKTLKDKCGTIPTL